ncbi:MAG TPA: hypothetical protein VMU01_09295 [Rhizomicrobium sp.]|nr:hypothetical protein [Rhizomicrobium sp.]
MKKASDLPAHIQTMMETFHGGLSPEEQADPRFAYRVIFVPKLGKRASAADAAVEFVKGDSQEAREISRVLLKEVDKPRYAAKQVVKLMKADGFPKFSLQNHTELWRALDAKDPAKGFGKEGVYRNTWEWFEPWVARVRAHCQEQGDRYR